MADEKMEQDTFMPDGTSSGKKEKKPRKRMSAAAQKKLRYGGIATAITAIVTIAVVLVNLLVSRVVETYPLKLDLTSSGMFEISQESVDFLKTLDKDVNFTVLMAESNFESTTVSMKMVSEMLDRYAQNSSHIHVSYVDPTTNPDVVNTLQANYTGTLTQGDIVVADAEDPSKMRVVSIDSLFSYDQQKYALYYYYGQGTLEDCITSFSGEQNLTAALMYVADADPVKVAVISMLNSKLIYSDANGYSVAMLAETLTKNGYDVTSVDLGTDALSPDDYDMIVLPAPINDLTQTDIDKLSAFLYNDGQYDRNLLYFADATQSDTPNIDELLSTWGIQVTKQLCMEGSDSAAQQVMLMGTTSTVPAPAAVITDEDYSAGMANTSLPIAAPFCRTIDLLWDEKSGGITSSVLQTSDTVYLNEMNAKEENSDKSAAGAQTVMATTTRRQNIDNIPHSSTIMVFGSMKLSDYYLMQDASYNNAPFMINAVNTVTGKGSGLVIAEKQLTPETLTLTTNDVRMVNLFIFAIPMAVAVIGVVVILRRRNK